MTQRTFLPGDHWLYYKIYTGVNTADTILSETVLPFAQQLQNNGLIDKWFFIRYTDPDFHLRLRFHLPDLSKLGDLQILFKEEMQAYVESDLVWKIPVDTYKRELERYGADIYDTIETIFSIDSNTVVNLLDMIEGEEGEEIRWLFGLKSLDNLLNMIFENDLAQKLSFIKNLADAFASEFNMNKYLRKQVNDKFKLHQEKIEKFIKHPEKLPDYQPVFSLLQQRDQEMQPFIQNTTISTRVRGSITHMMINRLFRSQNRLFEMLLYQFLFLFYRKELALKQNYRK